MADERAVGHEIFVSVAARTPEAERMREIVAEHAPIIALAYTQCCTSPGPASGLYPANRKARSSWSLRLGFAQLACHRNFQRARNSTEPSG